MALSKVTSTISMLIAVVIAYGIDQLIYYRFFYSKPVGDLGPAYLANIFAGLVLCLVWCALSWIILIKSQQSAVVSIIFIILGLLIYIWPSLQFLSQYVAINFHLFKHSFYNLQYTGLLIAALCLTNLMIPKYKTK